MCIAGDDTRRMIRLPLNDDCFLNILSYLPSIEAFSCLGRTSLLLQKFCRMEHVRLFSLRDLEKAVRLCPYQVWFSDLRLDFLPDLEELKEMRKIWDTVNWHGDRITVSFPWKSHGLVWVLVLLYGFRQRDVTAIREDKRSGGHGTLNCFFNLLEGEELGNRNVVRFHGISFQSHMLMPHPSSFWPTIVEVHVHNSMHKDCLGDLMTRMPQARLYVHE